MTYSKVRSGIEIIPFSHPDSTFTDIDVIDYLSDSGTCMCLSTIIRHTVT